jgi:hypothetical protein
MKNAKIVTLNKSIVDQLLSMNIENRVIKPTVVDRYARDINNGHWKLTNQGIGVSEDGVLLDGQHRLLAVAKCGYPPVEICIVYGLEKEAQRVVDQHMKRSARDIFRLSFNSVVSRHTPAILQVLAKYEPTAYTKSVSGKRLTLTIDDMFDMFEVLGESIEAVCSVVVKENFYAAPVIAACVHYLHNNYASIDQIQAFLDEVRLGENLTRKMPTFHLRNFLMSTRKSGAGMAMQIERYEKTKKALAAFVSGKEMSVLRV